jgi:acyl-CoA synthetase (AMP-forming)/AMP-acid ligase II
MALLLVHLTATAALAGLVWVVQLVVYPSFRLVGGGPAWPAFHAAHARAIALAVGPPWAVQGGTVAALLVRDGPTPLLLLTGALALATVVVTVAVSVPLHTRLGHAYDDGAARRLVTTNWLRTAAWSAGTVCAALLVARAS